jgi:hypothetical protein
MPIEFMEIFSEDIDSEQWQMLLQFIYAENINRYWSTRNPNPYIPELAEFIAGCITQAHEYFTAAKSVTLNTSPLLYYYGTTNLLSAVCSLLESRIPNIRGHGLEFNVPETRSGFSDLAIVTRWKEGGAYRRFCDTLAETAALEGQQSWTLLEILGSIPELKIDFEGCYPSAQPYVLPVETVSLDEHKLDRIALSDVGRFEDKQEMLERVPNLDQAYLPVSQTDTHLILRYRLSKKEIGVFSISGQKFLPLIHSKGSHNIVLPTILYCFLGLYALGFVSRYHPEIWTPFVRSDTTGERAMIERFIRTSARIIPNLALDRLFQKRLCFVNQRQGFVDLSERITTKKIREIVRAEMGRSKS